MLSEQDIYYEMLPFFDAVCAAIYIYIHVYQKEARYACGKYAPKIHEDKLSIYFQDRPPTIVISGSQPLKMAQNIWVLLGFCSPL